MKKNNDEKLLMDQVRLYCGQLGYIVLRLNSGTAYGGKLTFIPDLGNVVLHPSIIKLCPEGTSDLLIIMPNKIAFIETKIKPRKPTKEQLNFIDIMKKLGHIAGVVYSLDDLKILLG